MLLFLKSLPLWCFVFGTCFPTISNAQPHFFLPTSHRHDSHASSAKGDTKPHGRFLPLDVLIIPVIHKQELKGYFITQMTLEFSSEEQAKSARPKTPMLIDAIIFQLYGLAPLLHQGSKESPAPVESIKPRVLSALKEICPDIKAVLVEKFIKKDL